MGCQEVLIVGASSAGLYVSTLLARKGVQVVVYEASTALTPQSRTLIATPEFTRAMARFSDGIVLNRVQHMKLFSRSRSVRVSLGEPDVILDRSPLIRTLADQAQRAGVDLRLGHRFEGMESAGKALRLRFSRSGAMDTIVDEAHDVIAADGVGSRVAHCLGLNGNSLIASCQARIPLPRGLSASTAKVWFAPQETPYFYWLIPESEGTAVVGLAAHTIFRAKELLDGFLNRRGWRPMSYQASMVAGYRRNHRPLIRVGDATVYMVGDAAGQVKVTTIGGVVTGLWGAEAAAKTILGGGNGNAVSARVRWELDLHACLRAILNRFTDDDYDELLGLLNRRTLDLLRARNRDELTGIFWKLLMAQPRWVPFVARVLVRSMRRWLGERSKTPERSTETQSLAR